MSSYAKIRTDAVLFNPINPAGLENNSLLADFNDNNLLKTKDNSGNLQLIQSPLTLFTKVMQSGFVGTILAGTPVSKTSSGKIIPADSDAIGGQEPIGITLVIFNALDDIGTIHLFAPNVQGVLSLLGFVPGEEIFLGEAGGYTNNPNAFTGDNDSIIRIGIADCPSGTASVLATDLLINTQIILRP